MSYIVQSNNIDQKTDRFQLNGNYFPQKIGHKNMVNLPNTSIEN